MNSNYNKGVSRLMIALLATGMSLASCSGDDAQSGNEETKAVKVTITTRAAETDPWTAGDAIILQAYEGATTQTATYTFTSGTWSTETGLYWSSYQKTLDFLGYYPNTATAEGLAFALSTDQSDAVKFHAADYMTTDRICNQSNIGTSGTTVDFAFSHRLVKIVMNVTYGAEYADNLPTLSLERILSQGSGVSVAVNADNNAPSTVTTTGEAVWIQPLIGTNTAGKRCYTAFVAPGTLTSGSTALMTLAVNGEPRQAAYTGSLTALESGKAYNFNLKIGNSIEITSAANGTHDMIDGGDYDWQKNNFKSAYTIEDYFYWDAYNYVTLGGDSFGAGNYGFNPITSGSASHSCASCPTASQVVAYLKAGVYWDDNVTVTDGQQTYSAPDGSSDTKTNLHTGLWMKKKKNIANFNTEKVMSLFVTPTALSTLTDQEVKNIRTGGDYFFVPATGHFLSLSKAFVNAGKAAYYWSSTLSTADKAYLFSFSSSTVGIIPFSRGYYASRPFFAE